MSDASGSVIAALCCLFVVVAGSATVVAVVEDGTTEAVQQTGSSDGENVTTERRFGGDGADRLRAVVRTADGGYLLAGETDSFGDDTDAWLVRVDADRTERWNRTYGGPGYETLRDLQATGDGEYVAVGSTRSTSDRSSDVYALQVDDNGNVTWAETYSGPRYDDARSVATDGDGYTIAGTTGSRGSGGLSGWVLHVDTDGTPLWNRTYGGADDDVVNDIVRVDDGYVLAGSRTSGTEAVAGWVLHVGPDGQKRWERSLTDGAPTTAAAVVALDDPNGYVVVGERTPEGGGTADAWAARVNVDGSPVWNRTYGDGGPDTAVDAVVADGRPVFTGVTTISDRAVEPWLVALDPDNGRRSVTVAQTDGREHIGALAGTDRQFAVVGSTDRAGADGVFFEITADRNTQTPTATPTDGDSDGSDADPNTGGGGTDDDPNTGGSSSGGSTNGGDGGSASTPTAAPTTSVTPTVTPTSTPTVTPTATPTATTTPTEAVTTATATTAVGGETTVEGPDGDGGGQPPTTTMSTSTGTAPLFGVSVVLAIVLGLVLSGYRAEG